jgi:hypothetical protein
MWIKDLFSKRKPNHLIVYVLYKKEEKKLYKLLSKLTYSVGPFQSINDCILGVQKFIEKYPDKLKQINITSYGSGKYLVQTNNPQSKVTELVESLKPLMNEETKLMFTTCFSGVSARKVVEMSENLNGIEVSAMNGSYSLNGEMTKCKCKEKGYSEKVISKLPESMNGIRYDEKQIVDIVRRNEGEEINWNTSGMAYEYNKIVMEDGVCKVDKQPYTLLKCIRNFIFNTQS